MFSLINNELEIIFCSHLILSDCTGHHFMPEEARLLESEYLEDLYLIEFLFFHFPSSVHLMLKSHSSFCPVSILWLSGIYQVSFWCLIAVCQVSHVHQVSIWRHSCVILIYVSTVSTVSVCCLFRCPSWLFLTNSYMSFNIVLVFIWCPSSVFPVPMWCLSLVFQCPSGVYWVSGCSAYSESFYIFLGMSRNTHKRNTLNLLN